MIFQTFRLSWIAVVFLFVASHTQVALTQEVCPGKSNAFVLSRSETKQSDGTIKRTIRCQCSEGYESEGKKCVRITAARRRASCVSLAGQDLFLAIRDCRLGHNQPSLFSCLVETNISEFSLACLSTIPYTAAALPATIAACGLLVAKVPLDAKLRCIEISNSCLADALQRHKDSITICQR